MAGRPAILIIFTFISLLGGAQVASSQSWCAQARTPTEVAICSDSSLGERDEYITRIYNALRSAVSEKGKLRDIQRGWLKERSTCGADKTCLRDRYDQMITAYQQVSEKIGLQFPTPNFSNTAQANNNTEDASKNKGNTISIAEVSFSYTETEAIGNNMDALIVANSDYAFIPDLTTPAADAEIVGAAFKSRGITSTTIINPSREELFSTLMKFAQSPRKEVFVFYYAGHAADINGNPSVLFPDFRLDGTRANGHFQPINEVIAAVSKLGYKKVLIIFDACRNLVEIEKVAVVSQPSSPTSSDATTYRNLGSHAVDLNPLRNLDYAISFSAAEGQFAIDTLNGRNSPFAQAFAQNIREKETFFDAIIETRRDVKSATANRQQPRSC